MKKLRKVNIGFYGTPEFSLNFLQDLFLNDIKIAYVVSQPPRKSGRGKKLNFSPVHKWARGKNIKVFTPQSINDENFMKQIIVEKVDLNIVVAYGKILPKELINLPNLLSINIHASLLPRWRGAAPIQRAILSDDKETGVCIMRVDEKLDSGPIILDKKFKIQEEDNFGTIHDKIILYGKELLKQAIKKIVNKDFKYKYQKDSHVTYAKKIEKSECKILWNSDAQDINLKIRAFSPYPGAWTSFKNSNLRIKILKAKVIRENKKQEKTKYETGQIIDNFVVKCAKNFLKIEILQKEGKKPILAKEFINGNKIEEFFFT